MTNMRNSVQLIGRPGTDPEVKTFENKRTVAHFNLAVNSSYKNAEQKRVDHTQWFIDSTGKVIKEKRRRIEKKQFARSVVDFKLKDQ